MANKKEKGGDGWLKGGRDPWFHTKIETDDKIKRQRSREKPAEGSSKVQDGASLLFWEHGGTLQISKGVFTPT